MFSYDYKIRYSDYKDFDTVKPSSILEIIQEAAIRCSEECGFGVEDLRSMGLAWLLLGMNVHFDAPVSTHFPVTASTAVKSLKGVTSERCTVITQGGKQVVKAIANWCLLNTKRMRLARIPQEMISAYEFFDTEDNFFTYIKPEIIEEAPLYHKVRVANRDIDTNCHLNNQKGAELLMDALPFDFHFADICLCYNKPCYLGDVLDVCRKELEKGYYVHLKNEKGEVCVTGTFFN